MKIKKLALITALALASLSGANAANLTSWTFDNLSTGANGSPSPSSGFGAASAIGMGGGSNPDVQSLAGSSSGGPNSWRIRATGINNGWSTNAAIGSQGAKFGASTAGYYKIKVSFDVYATTDAEANLQVQYTTEGSIWRNLTNITVTGSTVVTNNSATNSTVRGTYLVLASGWNNQIVADLSGVSGVDNNSSFALRMVNASTSTNCVDTTGAIYNNTSGSWTFDNVIVQGDSIDTIAQWTFESEGVTAFIAHPAPEYGSGTATSIGFDNNYNYSDGTVGSTNKPDILNNGAPFSSSGSAGQAVWRVRGAGAGSGHNGWNTAAPIGTQGAEFDVSTVNYNDIVISFDLFSTSQGEAKMCVLYTTDGSTWNNATNLFYGINPTFVFTNAGTGYSSDTVAGTYFYQNTGQNFFNNFVVDFTGMPGVANNPNFGIRIVNAAQGNDCLAFNGGSYNNSSGNWRYDNVTFGGTFTGSLPPTIAYDPTATVDNNFTNTFTDDATWRNSITAVYVNGLLLTNSAYTTNVAGQFIFNPSKSAALKVSGIKNIVIYANGYGNAKFVQPLAAGVATKLAITTQPTAPSASGGTLIANPALAITDQYGNGTTNPYANVVVTATAGGAGGWTLGGSAVQPSVSGFAVFSNLTATVNGSSAVSGAAINFSIAGYPPLSVTNSSTFNIGAPPTPFTPGNLAILQIDTGANNTTFSIIEVKPSVASQTSPVNIFPISATGTNGLRQSSSGSTGRLALSDDGTLACFAAFIDQNSATPDETFNLERAAAGINYTNRLTLGLTYTSASLGGSQARAACTLDNTNWIADDKGGLYYGSAVNPAVDINGNNNIVVKTFGGVPYVETQKTAGGSPIPVVYALDPNNPTVTVPNNLGTDPVATDFYLVSTNAGVSFDIMYVIDQISSTFGLITKYSWVPDNTQITGFGWATNGTFATTNGADGLFAATNGNGGTYLYYTSGGGGTTGNSIVRLTDASGWNQNISIISSNIIYTASSTTSIKGLTFAPQQNAHAVQPTPPPILIAQASANVSAAFTVTNSPDVPAWRTSITSITVNGLVLSPTAYDATQPGKITFNPSLSMLLQTNGNKAIVISATGFSAASVTQSLAIGAAVKLAFKTQAGAPAADGGLLNPQPTVLVQDLYGNTVTNSTASITAAPVQATWTLGGVKIKNSVGGTNIFTDLTAFATTAITGATISFTSGSLTAVTNAPFNIPAPVISTLTSPSLTGGKFAFNFTNFTGLSFSVLSTNNVTAPISTWPVIGTAVENPTGSGSYHFTNTPAGAVQFYMLRQP